MSKVISYDNTAADRLRALEELQDSPVGTEVVGQQDWGHAESHYKLVDEDGTVEVTMLVDGEVTVQFEAPLEEGLEATRDDVMAEELMASYVSD